MKRRRRLLAVALHVALSLQCAMGVAAPTVATLGPDASARDPAHGSSVVLVPPLSRAPRALQVQSAWNATCASNAYGSPFNCSRFLRKLKPAAATIASDGLVQTCCDRLPCPAPRVTIGIGKSLTIRPSTAAVVNAVGILPVCEVGNARLQFEWRCNNNTMELDQRTKHTNRLSLMPFSMEAMDNITLTVSAWLSSTPNLTATASIAVKCVATPEVFAAISGGSSRLVYPGTDVILDGTSSTDPDSPDVVWDNVIWSCQDVTDGNTSVACFDGADLPSPSADGLTWNLTDLVFQSQPCEMLITLSLTEKGRHDSATLRLRVSSSRYPGPEVSILNWQPKFSASSRLVLEGAAIPVGPQLPTFTWEWSAFEISNSGTVLPDGLLPLESWSRTPVSNPTLVVNPGSLTAGCYYRFRLEVFDTRETGVVEVDIVMNTPPRGGNVTVVPNEGMAISDTFTVTAQGWRDADIPLNYAFGYRCGGPEANVFMLLPTSLSSSVGAVLPVTATVLTVQVSDSYSASAQAMVHVKVNPYVPAEGFDILADATERITSSLTNGNIQRAAQLVTAFAGALGHNSSAMSEDELGQAHNTRSVLADTLVALSADAEDAPPDQLQLMAQSAAAVTSGAGQLSAAAMENVVDAVTSLGSAKAMKGQMTPPQGSSCRSSEACTMKGGDQRCRTVHACTDLSGNSVKPRIEPVPDSLVSTVVGAISNINAGRGSQLFASKVRELVHTAQRSMIAGVMPGEIIKKIGSPLVDLAIQVDSPEKLTGHGAVELAPNVRAQPPLGAFSNGSHGQPSVVEMSAAAWAAGASPYPEAAAPPRRKPKAGPNQIYDGRNDTATDSTVMSTKVLSLEFAAEGGEEIEIEGLSEPFVIEIQVDENAFACDSVSDKMIMCGGFCVPRGNCEDRAFQFCSYYDTNLWKWVIDPQAPPGSISEDGRTVTCLFNHLTDMASFMGAPPGPTMNAPCFSCTSAFLYNNPWGRLIVFLCLFFLFYTAAAACRNYSRFSKTASDVIYDSQFAQSLTSNRSERTRLIQDLCHRLRHDYACGGILCFYALDGDPFDWAQRLLVLVTMMIVSLTTSLLFLQDPNQDETVAPDCNETCSQLNETEPTICVVDCAELEESLGLYMASTLTVSASCIMTILASCLMDASFRWLRRPVTKAVALEASMVSVSQAAVIGNRSVVPRSTDRPSMRATAAGNERDSNEYRPSRNDDSSDNAEPEPELELEPEAELVLTPGGVFSPFEQELVSLRNLGDDAQWEPSALGSEPELQLIRPATPIAEPRGQDDESVAISAVPRPLICAIIPIFVAVVLGLFGILMIYVLSAYLAPSNIKVWLIAASTSFVFSTIIFQPLRVVADAVLLKCADEVTVCIHRR